MDMQNVTENDVAHISRYGGVMNFPILKNKNFPLELGKYKQWLFPQNFDIYLIYSYIYENKLNK